MSKKEFLKELTASLSKSLDKESLQGQIDYYDKYIDDEVAKGRDEREVIAELGEPRLIAKTIKTVTGTENVIDADTSENNTSYGGYGKTSSGYDASNQYTNQNTNQNNKNFNGYFGTTNTIGCLIFFLVFFIIIMSILRFLGYLALGVGTFAFSGPVGFFIVMMIIWLFFMNKR